MHSSPELDPEDEMFPDEAGGPSTPTNAATFALDPSSELSPPNSQGPSQVREDPFAAAYSGSPSTLNANGKRVHPTTAATLPTSAPSSTGQYVHKASGYTWDKPEDEPGYDWLNKRAQEEHARAWESIVDKASMIRSKCSNVCLLSESGLTLRRSLR